MNAIEYLIENHYASTLVTMFCIAMSLLLILVYWTLELMKEEDDAWN